MARDDIVNNREAGIKISLPATLLRLREALGDDRVQFKNDCIVLQFNVKDPLEFEQFSLVAFVRDAKTIHCFAEERPEKDGVYHIYIPTEHMGVTQDKHKLAYLADRLGICFGIKDDEVHHPIIEADDPAHLLVHATQMPWHRVTGSKYGIDALEPSVYRSQMTAARRLLGEFTAGRMLLPKFADTRAMEWIEYQQKVEEENGKPPRMLIPEEWLSSRFRTHAEKVLTDEELRKNLPKIFGA